MGEGFYPEINIIVKVVHLFHSAVSIYNKNDNIFLKLFVEQYDRHFLGQS